MLEVWRMKRPTVPGWYWWKTEKLPEPVIVKVNTEGQPELGIYFWPHLDYKGEEYWCGPLQHGWVE